MYGEVSCKQEIPVIMTFNIEEKKEKEQNSQKL